MKILGIESASLVASVAIINEETILAEYTVNHKKTHSQTLLPMLNEIVSMLEADLNDIDAIAVSGGPGSFTGLRIGAATAKGLGLALEKPLIHVPTIDAMAYNFFGDSRLICPMLDARRLHVYTGLYEFVSGNELHPVLSQCVIDLESLLNQINQYGREVVFLGDGVPVSLEKIKEKLTVPYSLAPGHMNRQRAASVASLGLVLLKEGKETAAAAFAPEYLRLAQAERELNNRANKVRKMNHKDLEWVCGLEQQSFSDAWSYSLMSSSLADPNSFYYIIEEKGVNAGYLCGRKILDEAEIHRIAIKPELRRRGLARRLAGQFLSDLKAAGVKAVTLEVRSRNTAAIGMYESLGFIKEGLRKGYYHNPADDAVIMWKK